MKIGNRMINSRADSVLEKPAFKRAAKSRRCLVPAEGWYEWQKSPDRDGRQGQAAQAALLHRTAPTATSWPSPGSTSSGATRPSTDPDDPDAWLTIVHHHHRPTPSLASTASTTASPWCWSASDWAAWLDPQTDEETVRRLLAFEQPGRFDAYPISTEVNNTRNNGPELLLPLAAEELHGVVDTVTGEVIGAR